LTQPNKTPFKRVEEYIKILKQSFKKHKLKKERKKKRLSSCKSKSLPKPKT